MMSTEGVAQTLAVALPVGCLLARWNPFDLHCGPWATPVSRDDVANALRHQRLVSAPVGNDHAGRIAYLVKLPTTDPITIDVGIPALGYDGPAWGIVDGNHRLAAAAFRGDVQIYADIEGDIDWMAEYFGVVL